MQKKKQEESIREHVQPELNIGLVGHVDHGKSTLVQALTGKWTATHSEELKRGITIRLGYADTTFYKCSKCEEPKCYGTKEICENCKDQCILLRKVSFIDAPGHETLMATMLSGAAIMDAAILLVAANENCPQPQTREHLMALTMTGINNIIIVQNKIDLVSKEDALKNYEQIKKFVKGTIAENAPIIPISAQHKINIDILIKTIQDNFITPKRDLDESPLFFIARSFDVNKPGEEIEDLSGGVLGGVLKQGKLEVNNKVEISPGRKLEREGKTFWQTIRTEIIDIKTGGGAVKEVTPGGSIGLLTKLDPNLVKADSLAGNVLGLIGKLPPVWHEFNLKPELLERIVGAKDELKVEPIKKAETLMLNVNSAATVGVVNELKKNIIHVKLKIPVCCNKEDRITISRIHGGRWRLIGVGEIVS